MARTGFAEMARKWDENKCSLRRLLTLSDEPRVYVLSPSENERTQGCDMGELQVCPICNHNTPVIRVLEDIRVQAKVNGDTQINGLVTYQCREMGHIFFVRSADLDSPLDLPGEGASLGQVLRSAIDRY